MRGLLFPLRRPRKAVPFEDIRDTLDPPDDNASDDPLGDVLQIAREAIDHIGQMME